MQYSFLLKFVNYRIFCYSLSVLERPQWIEKTGAIGNFSMTNRTKLLLPVMFLNVPYSVELKLGL